MVPTDAVIGKWICLFSQPRHEKLAVLSLQDAGFEAYLPQYKTFVTHARKRRADIRPLFHRYVFARIQDNTPIIWSAYRLNGVSGYAGKSLENSILRNDVIEAIRRREGEDGMILMDFSTIAPGKKVKLLQGPFAGFEAIFSEADDAKRSWIFVEFLGKMHRKRVENRDLELVL